MMHQHTNSFEKDPERASRAGKLAQSRKTPEQRTAQARKAALIRWSKRNETKETL